MWTVVFIAPTESKAELIAAKLSEEGMMVKVRSLKGSANQEFSSAEILVPESEAEEALELIQSILAMV